jgi:hypothetical protein
LWVTDGLASSFLPVLFFVDRHTTGGVNGVNGWIARLTEMNGWYLQSAFAAWCHRIENKKSKNTTYKTRVPPFIASCHQGIEASFSP